MGSKGSQTVPTAQTQTYSPAPAAQAAIMQALGQAQGVAQTPFQTPIAPVAPFSPQQQQAFNITGAAQGMALPYINQAAYYMGPQGAAAFANPFIGNVTANLQDIYGQQMSQATGQAVAQAGGTGADRIAVAQSQLAKQQALAAGQTYAGLYGQAQQAAQTAGFGTANLGTAAQNATLQGAQALLGTGGLQQQLAQAQLNAPYQNLLQQIAWPYQNAQFLAGITGALAPGLGGTTSGMGTTTYPGASPLGTIAGLGMAGLGAYGMANQGAFNGGWSGSGIGPAASQEIAPVEQARGGRTGYAPGGVTADDSAQPAPSGTDTLLRMAEEQQLARDAAPSGAPVGVTSTPANMTPQSMGLNAAATSGANIIPQTQLNQIQPKIPQLNLSQPQQSSGGGKGSGMSDVASIMGSVAKIAPLLLAQRGGRIQHFDDGGDVQDPWAALEAQRPAGLDMLRQAATKGDPAVPIMTDHMGGYDVPSVPASAPATGGGLAAINAAMRAQPQIALPANALAMDLPAPMLRPAPRGPLTPAERAGVSGVQAEHGAGPDTVDQPDVTSAVPQARTLASPSSYGTREPIDTSMPSQRGMASMFQNPWGMLLLSGLGTLAASGQRDAHGLPMSPWGAIGTGVMSGIKQEQSIEDAAKKLDLEAKKHLDQYTRMTPHQEAQIDIERRKQAFAESLPHTVNDPLLGQRTIVHTPKGWVYLDTGLPVDANVAATAQPQTSDNAERPFQTVTPSSQTVAQAIQQGLTGRAFLDAVPQPMRNTIEAVGNYDQPLSVFSKGQKGLSQDRALALVRQFNPDYDGYWATARGASLREFLAGGPNSPAAQIRSYNTAIGHAGDAWDAIQEAKRIDPLFLQKAANAGVPFGSYIAAQLANRAVRGTPMGVALNKYMTAMTLYSAEATKLYSGAQGSQEEKNTVRAPLDPALSLPEIEKGLSTSVHMMGSRGGALEDQYKVAMQAPGLAQYGTKGEVKDFPVLHDRAERVLKNMGIDPKEALTGVTTEKPPKKGDTKQFSVPGGGVTTGVWDGTKWVPKQ